MKRTTITRYCAMWVAVITLGSTSAFAAENLGEVLRESRWDRMIGTWVDAETKGEKHKVTFAWRYPDRLLEITSRDGDSESVSLMGLNPKTGNVFHMGADNQNGSSIGKWTFEEGEALLGVLFVSSDKQEGSLAILLNLEDDDAMVVTVQVAEPVIINLIRAK